MFENVEEYQKILDRIAERTGGDYDKMSYSDKLMTVAIMKEYKKSIDKFMLNEYYTMKMWAELDVEQIKLEETEPDFNKFGEPFLN